MTAAARERSRCFLWRLRGYAVSAVCVPHAWSDVASPHPRQGAVRGRSGSHRRCPGSWGAASSVPGGRRLRPARHRLWRPRPPVSVQPPPVFNVLYLHHCNHLAKHAGSRLPTRRRRCTWTRRLSLQRSVLEINRVFVQFDPRSPVLFICFNPYPVHAFFQSVS